MAAGGRHPLRADTPRDRRACLALALKTLYFDGHANAQPGSSATHALRASPLRGVVWSLLHIPLNASAVLLAAGYDVSKSLPAGLQLDWEAFYAASPQEFAHVTARYLSLTPCRHSTSEIPAVSDLIVSTTDMHRALLATSTSSSDLL